MGKKFRHLAFFRHKKKGCSLLSYPGHCSWQTIEFVTEICETFTILHFGLNCTMGGGSEIAQAFATIQ